MNNKPIFFILSLCTVIIKYIPKLLQEKMTMHMPGTVLTENLLPFKSDHVRYTWVFGGGLYPLL